jgi:hypothetical protein
LSHCHILHHPHSSLRESRRKSGRTSKNIATSGEIARRKSSKRREELIRPFSIVAHSSQSTPMTPFGMQCDNKSKSNNVFVLQKESNRTDGLRTSAEMDFALERGTFVPPKR